MWDRQDELHADMLFDNAKTLLHAVPVPALLPLRDSTYEALPWLNYGRWDQGRSRKSSKGVGRRIVCYGRLGRLEDRFLKSA